MTRIGLDVGGTFTDVVALDERTGGTSWFKVSTNVEAPGAGVLDAIAATAAAYEDIQAVRLGTTLGVNALLTGAGSRTGLITTRGFRDVLEIRRTHRQHLFDLDETFPEPLVPRDLRLEVDERTDADGAEVRPLDEAGVREAWRALRAAGVESVAVVFLFSFENPAHELRAREILLEEGAPSVFLSSRGAPGLPRVRADLHDGRGRPHRRRRRGLRAAARRRPDGARPARRAALDHDQLGRRAVGANDRAAPDLDAALRSGRRRRGVALARRAGRPARHPDARHGRHQLRRLGVVDGVPDERLDMQIGGHTISYPTYDIETIGAGGGSLAWIDSGGTLRVGPQSAGSHPGPACYGRGGDRPTVTDANLVLGRYDVAALLGGTVRLDLELARRAIHAHVAEPLGMSVEEAAAGILRIVNVLMITQCA